MGANALPKRSGWGASSSACWRRPEGSAGSGSARGRSARRAREPGPRAPATPPSKPKSRVPLGTLPGRGPASRPPGAPAPPMWVRAARGKAPWKSKTPANRTPGGGIVSTEMATTDGGPIRAALWYRSKAECLALWRQGARRTGGVRLQSVAAACLSLSGRISRGDRWN
jgi:hypothetical protein